MPTDYRFEITPVDRAGIGARVDRPGRGSFSTANIDGTLAKAAGKEPVG